MRSRSLSRVACATSIALLTAGCGPLPGIATDATPAASGTGPQAAPSPGTRNRVAPTANCPTSPTTREEATGRELRVATLSFSAPDFNRDVVVAAEDLPGLPEALATGEFLDMDYAFLHRAYAAGGAYAQVTFENTTDANVSVFNVRPANITVDCVPLGALVAYGNEGGDPAQMIFNMDAAAPLARTTGDSDEPGRPYFEEFPAIELDPHQKETLLLEFTTDFGAYTFDMIVSYEVNGVRDQTMLRNGFVPFRVATDLCPAPEARLAMSPEEVAHMSSLRYQNVRRRGPDWNVVTEAPDDAAGQCATW